MAAMPIDTYPALASTYQLMATRLVLRPIPSRRSTFCIWMSSEARTVSGKLLRTRLAFSHAGRGLRDPRNGIEDGRPVPVSALTSPDDRP